LEELCYTSIAEGLDRGKTGYTVAGRTSAMSKTLSDQAEKLSGFDALDPNNPMGYAREPVQYSHLVMRLSAGRSHIVTRRAACPPDYTGRSNFLAHHALLSEAEAAACRGGPAALAAHDGFLMTKWEGDARSLPNRPVPALIDRGPSAAAFEAAGLDAGWAASLADRVLDPGTRQTWLIYSPDMNILGMVADVLSQVDPANRWAMTFATHATRSFPGPGADCRIQCVVAGTEYAREVIARRGADVFDLTTRGAAPPRRTQASVAQPAGRTVTATRGGFPATAGAAARGPSRPLEPTPIGQDEFLLPSPPRQTSTGKPDYRGRGDGFGLPWVAIPAALAVAMTFATGLTGYLWQTTNQTLEKKVDEIRTLKDEIRDLKKEHKRAIADQQADVEAQRKDSPPPAQATTQTPDKNGADEKKASPESENEAAPPAEMKSDTPESPKPDPDTAQATSPASPPRDSTAPSKLKPTVSASVIEDVKQAIQEKRPKASVTLLTNIGEQPDKDAFSLSPNGTPIGLLDAEIKPQGQQASIYLLGKKAAAIRYSEKENHLVLDITANSDTAFLLKYVTLRIEGVGAKPIDIALGRPVDAKLWIRPAVLVDRQQQDKQKTSDIFRQYNLFDSDTDSGMEATQQLQLVLSCKACAENNLLEHFEFGDAKVTTRLMKELKPSPGDTFTFYTTGTASRPIGVQFMRSTPGTPDLRPPPTYKLHGLYCTVVSRVDKDLLEYDAITKERFDKIKAAVRRETAALEKRKGDDKKTNDEIEAKLKSWNDDIATDINSWEEAIDFPPALLQDRPFRLTLKPRGSTDKGIVVVDSLGGNAGPKAGSEEKK
jgi:GTPase-associated protein 1, N-terminal domain type 2/GTPase-associated protein 1, middle domain